MIPSGPDPMGRLGGRSILDSTHEGIVLFGGALYSGEAESSRLTNDLWRLRGLRPGESARGPASGRQAMHRRLGGCSA